MTVINSENTKYNILKYLKHNNNTNKYLPFNFNSFDKTTVSERKRFCLYTICIFFPFRLPLKLLQNYYYDTAKV